MNKKIMFLTVFVLLISFHSSSTRADQIKIFTPESSVIVYAGQLNELKIPVKNEGKTTDTFYLSIWPSQWITLEKYWVSLDPGESKDLTLFIIPPEEVEEGKLVFTATITSLNTGIIESKPLYLDVKRTTDVFITEIRMNKQLFKPGEVLIIQPILTNINKIQSQKVYLSTKVMKDGLVVEKFDEVITLKPKTVKTLTYFFNITIDRIFGDYEVEVTLRNSLNELMDKEKSSFKIEKFYNVVKKETKEYGLFYTKMLIEIINMGNVPNSDYTLTESVPKIFQYLFHPEIEPDTKEIKDNRVVYIWLIKGLDPEQSKTIEYEFRFVNLFVVSIIVIIIILIGLWFVTRPALSKRFIGILGEDKEVTISLHVKNRGRSTLHNVTVKDFVPAIAKVVRKFDTLAAELTRKNEGTELVWDIKKIKPKEEIVLTYRIKPVVEVMGELKLPKAHFTYGTYKGRRSRIASKTITIKGKIK